MHNKNEYVLHVKKSNIEDGMSKLVEEANRLREKINTTSAYTPEETKNRLEMIVREQTISNILYSHFGIQQHEYSNKHFVEID